MFEKWMQNYTDLSDASIYKYSNSIQKIDLELVKNKIIKSKLEKINFDDLEETKNYFFSIPENKALDERGHGMYSAAFNNYIFYRYSMNIKTIGDVNSKIISEYPKAISQTKKDHPLDYLMRKLAPKIIENNLPIKFKKLGYTVKCSSGIADKWVGSGDSSKNPWLGIFHPDVTTGTSKGYFVAYSFMFKSNEIVLGIGQGHEEIEKKFGKKNSVKFLNYYSETMLSNLKSNKYFEAFEKGNKITENPLESGRFGAGIVLHKTYSLKKLSNDNILRKDLNLILDAYEEIYQNGGRNDIDISLRDDKDDDKIEFGEYIPAVIIDIGYEKDKKVKSGNKKRQQGHNDHKNMQNEMSELLNKNGFDFNRIKTGPKVDLSWKTQNGISIAEVKSIRENEVKQIRSAIGQMAEYKYRLEQEKFKIDKCYIVVSSEPRLKKRWNGILKNLGFYLITPKNLNDIIK